MLQDSWSLYDTPRHPKKWMFHPRKRSFLMPLATIAAAVWVLFEAVGRFF